MVKRWKCLFATWLFNRWHEWPLWENIPIGEDLGDGLMKQIGTYSTHSCRCCGQHFTYPPVIWRHTTMIDLTVERKDGKDD